MGKVLYLDQTPSQSLLLRCSVSLAVAVLGLIMVIVNISIQSHMKLIQIYLFIRLPKLSARNSAGGLAT